MMYKCHMAQPRFEIAVGAIDGSNKIFRVSAPYVSSSTAVFLNGKLCRKDWDDGWEETSPAAGTITLKEAPLAGDSVQVFFTDLSPARTEGEVTPLHGHLTAVGTVRGRVVESEVRVAVIRGI